MISIAATNLYLVLWINGAIAGTVPWTSTKATCMVEAARRTIMMVDSGATRNRSVTVTCETMLELRRADR